jgi:hypothetical protein
LIFFWAQVLSTDAKVITLSQTNAAQQQLLLAERTKAGSVFLWCFYYFVIWATFVCWRCTILVFNKIDVLRLYSIANV